MTDAMTPNQPSTTEGMTELQRMNLESFLDSYASEVRSNSGADWERRFITGWFNGALRTKNDEIKRLEARVKEQDGLLTALKIASTQVSLPEYKPVEVMQQSDGTWWMDHEDCYASIDLDRGGFVGVEDAKSKSETMRGQFHWGDLPELDVFITLLLVSRKTYIEKGVARYRAETGL